MTLPTSLRAGIIGLGIGARHIAGYQAHARCSLVALCDIDTQRLQALGAQYPGLRVTTEAADILSDPQINVVSIASYDNYHSEQVVASGQCRQACLR